MNSDDNINYVTFDLFGTLINFGVQYHPFRQLLKWARENGRPVRSDDARTVMTINGGFEAISRELGINPPNDLLRKLEEDIARELSSLALFDDAMSVISSLQSRNIRIAVCSNLAQPYGAIINTLLSDVDVELFLSYELGTIKPETQMYESILQRFNCAPDECLFIGDTYDADYVGPISVGMRALHLARKGVTQPYQIRSLNELLKYVE